eukprot:gene23226-31552_t
MPVCSALFLAHLRKTIKQSIRNIIIGPRSFSSTVDDVIEVDKIAEKTVIEDEYSMYSVQDLKSRLLQIAALTNRGENIQEKQQALALSLVEAIERRNTIINPATSSEILGVWNLAYSNTYLFRSSPFFMAARAICQEGAEADTFNRFCRMHREALAFTSIGAVKQIVSESSLRSEFETNVAALPGLPIVIRGTIVSTADIESRHGGAWTLFMDRVRIKEGSSNVPVLGGLLNSFAGLDSRRLSTLLQSLPLSLSSHRSLSPRPVFRTNFVDDGMRISRDQDDNVFVYTRG